MIFITIIHVFVCLSLIMIVLLQTGKGAEMGASFGGGGGNQAMVGASGGATLLSKVTTAMAIIFMLTSLVLAYNSSPGVQKSVVKDIPAQAAEAIPATVSPATEPAPETQPTTE